MGIELAGSILHNSADFVDILLFFFKAAIALSGPVLMPPCSSAQCPVQTDLRVKG